MVSHEMALAVTPSTALLARSLHARLQVSRPFLPHCLSCSLDLGGRSGAAQAENPPTKRGKEGLVCGVAVNKLTTCLCPHKGVKGNTGCSKSTLWIICAALVPGAGCCTLCMSLTQPPSFWLFYKHTCKDPQNPGDRKLAGYFKPSRRTPQGCRTRNLISDGKISELSLKTITLLSSSSALKVQAKTCSDR